MKLLNLHNKYSNLSIDLDNMNKLHLKMKKLILAQKRNLNILFSD